MSENTIKVSDDTFDSVVLSSKTPVLVDFWATWCGPCKVLAPILDEIAAEKSATLTVAKVDVDQNPKTASEFKIMSIPTLILFVNGKPKHTIVGAKSKAALLKEIDPAL